MSKTNDSFTACSKHNQVEHTKKKAYTQNRKTKPEVKSKQKENAICLRLLDRAIYFNEKQNLLLNLEIIREQGTRSFLKDSQKKNSKTKKQTN